VRRREAGEGRDGGRGEEAGSEPVKAEPSAEIEVDGIGQILVPNPKHTRHRLNLRVAILLLLLLLLLLRRRY
jgi:hypothetical protein